MVEAGSHITVQEASGKTLLDGASGLWCVNIGYGRDEVAKAIYEQARKLPFFHSFTSMANEPAIRLAERIADMAPDRITRVLFGSSGSDANDTNVKLVWYYNNVRGRPQKKKIISRHRAYHGVSVAAGSLTGLPIVQDAFDLPIPQVRFASPTY